VTARVVSNLDKDLLRRLLVPIPAALRFTLDPSRLLAALDITVRASTEKVAEGVTHLTVNTSGNFRIDEPFVDRMYRVVGGRRVIDPAQPLDIIAGSEFPMEEFILNYPGDAAGILSTNLATTTELVKSSDPVIFPPARFIYRLIKADPLLAAQVVQRLEEQGKRDLVLESLAYLAYDARRLALVPTLPIALEADGQFLAHLSQLQGALWLGTGIREVVGFYYPRMVRGDVPPDFVESFRETLQGAIALLEDGPVKRELEEVTERYFRIAFDER